MAGKPRRRERTLYEIASSFFAGCVIVFAVAGMAAAALGDEGLISLPFAICALFLLLGVGRLYLGWVRGSEGAEERGEAAERPPVAPPPPRAAGGSSRLRRRGH